MFSTVKNALESLGIKFGETPLTRLDIEVEGRPLIKKNSKNIWFNKSTGKRFVGSNKNYAKHSGGQLEQLIKFKENFEQKNIFPITDNIIIQHEFHFTDRKLPDVSNALESINDLLQQAGIIANDKQIATTLCPIRVLNPNFTGTRVRLFWSPDIKLTAGDIPKKKAIRRVK